MPEQLQKIINQVVEWWKKFNTKQKALLISIVATVLLALVILAVVMGKPTMQILVECENTAEAGQVKDLLDGENTISYQLSQDGLTFYVDEKNLAEASILLGQNNIPTMGYALENVFEGGFSATEADKTKKYKMFQQKYMEEQIQWFSNVEKASVMLDIPTDDGTILAREEEAYASVILTLSGTMEEEQAAGIAKYIATQLGNDTTDNITIIDSDANVLFAGGDSNTEAGIANNQITIRSKLENQIIGKVKDVMVGASLYDHVEVATKLEINFDQLRETQREFFAPEGQTNGMIGEESAYESNTVGGNAGVPGTDSNDDTTYVLEDNNYTESNVTDVTKKYQNNEKVTDRTAATGTIICKESSIAVVAKNYTIFDEDVLKASGALDDMTFDEYIAANSEPVKMDVDQDYYTMVANATGFPVENISIIAYTEPIFRYSSNQRSLQDYMQIILAVLIFLLLGFVVFRSTRKEKTAELEPELSVESLLESTKETQQEEMEDIGFNEKSETRILIEKFVQENPEAAAALLRNWLNEEWE